MSIVQLSGDLPKVSVKKVLLESNVNGTAPSWDEPHIVDPIYATLSDPSPSENLNIGLDLVVKDQKQKSGLGSWIGKQGLLYQYLKFGAAILPNSVPISQAKSLANNPNNITAKRMFVNNYIFAPLNNYNVASVSISVNDFKVDTNVGNQLVLQGVSGGSNEIQSEKDLINSNTLSDFVFSLKHELASEPNNLYIATYSYIDIDALLASYPDLHIDDALGDANWQTRFVSDILIEPVIVNGQLNKSGYRYEKPDGSTWFGDKKLFVPDNLVAQTVLEDYNAAQIVSDEFNNDGNPTNFQWVTDDNLATPLTPRPYDKNIIQDFRITKKITEQLQLDTNIFINPASSYPTDESFSVYNPAIEKNYPSLKAPIIGDMYPSRDPDGNCGFMFSFNHAQFVMENAEFPNAPLAIPLNAITSVKITREKVKRKEYKDNDFLKSPADADTPPFWDEPTPGENKKTSEINSNHLNFELEKNYNESPGASLLNTDSQFKKVILNKKLAVGSPDKKQLVSIKSDTANVRIEEMELQLNSLSNHEHIRCFTVVDKDVASEAGLYRYTVEFELFDNSRQTLANILPSLKKEAKAVKAFLSKVENNPGSYDYTKRQFSELISWPTFNPADNFIKPLDMFLESTGLDLNEAGPSLKFIKFPGALIAIMNNLTGQGTASIPSLIAYQKLIDDLLQKYNKMLSINKTRKIETIAGEASESSVETSNENRRKNKIAKAFPTLFDASGFNSTGLSYIYNESNDMMGNTLLILDPEETTTAMDKEYLKYFKTNGGVFEGEGKSLAIDPSRYSFLTPYAVYRDGLKDDKIILEDEQTSDKVYSKLFMSLLLNNEMSQKFYDKTYNAGPKTSDLLEDESKLESILSSRNLNLNQGIPSWPQNTEPASELSSFDEDQDVAEPELSAEVGGFETDLMGTSDILFSLVSSDKLKTVDSSLVDKFNLALDDNFFARYKKSIDQDPLVAQWLVDLPIQIKYIIRSFQEYKGDGVKFPTEVVDETFAPYIIDQDIVGSLQNLGHFFFNFQTLVRIEYLDSYEKPQDMSLPNVNAPTWKTLDNKALNGFSGASLFCRLSVYDNNFVVDQTIADLRLMTYNKHFILTAP
jgi:hypothetical protein